MIRKVVGGRNESLNGNPSEEGNYEDMGYSANLF